MKRASPAHVVTDIRVDPDHARVQTFLDGQLQVLSPRGLRATDELLLRALPELSGERVLTGFGGRGLLSTAIKSVYPKAEVVDFQWDLQAAESADLCFRSHHDCDVTRAPAAQLSDLQGPFDLVLCPAPNAFDKTLVLEFLEQIPALLSPQGVLLLAIDNSGDDWYRRQIKAHFGAGPSRLLETRRKGLVLRGVLGKGPRKGPKERFHSRPLSFCEHSLSHVRIAGTGLKTKWERDELSLLEHYLRERDAERPATALDVVGSTGLFSLALKTQWPELSLTTHDHCLRSAACFERSWQATLPGRERPERIVSAQLTELGGRAFDLILARFDGARVDDCIGQLRSLKRCLTETGQLLVFGPRSQEFRSVVARVFPRFVKFSDGENRSRLCYRCP